MYTRKSTELTLRKGDTMVHVLVGHNTRVTTRMWGDIPGCIPAPHDETWCESQGLPDYEDGPLNLKFGHIGRNEVSDKYVATVQAYRMGNLSKDNLRVILESKCYGVTGRPRQKFKLNGRH